MLSSTTALTSLELRKFNNADAISAVRSISAMTGLQRLSFPSSMIDLEGFWSMAPHLRALPGLKVLSLELNWLGAWRTSTVDVDTALVLGRVGEGRRGWFYA